AGPWPYYTRPRLGEDAFTPDDVAAVRTRMRELGVPEAIEWVHETTPALLGAVRATGMDVLKAPLMTLNRTAFRPSEAPPKITGPSRDADDPTVAAAHTVATVGFTAAGTAPGPEGVRERDAATSDDEIGLRLERMRRRITVTAVAENQTGPVATG